MCPNSSYLQQAGKLKGKCGETTFLLDHLSTSIVGEGFPFRFLQKYAKHSRDLFKEFASRGRRARKGRAVAADPCSLAHHFEAECRPSFDLPPLRGGGQTHSYFGRSSRKNHSQVDNFQVTELPSKSLISRSGHRQMAAWITVTDETCGWTRQPQPGWAWRSELARASTCWPQAPGCPPSPCASCASSDASGPVPIEG